MKKISFKNMLLKAVCLLALLPMAVGTVSAAGNSASLSLPVTQEFTVKNKGTDKVNLTGEYVLTALDKNAPLPNGSKNGTYEFSITGKNQQIQLSMEYEKAGIYRYTLQQTTKDAEKYTYDRSLYSITVYIQNTPSGKLSPQVIVEDGSEGKCAEIRFANSYKGTPKPGEPAKTGDSAAPGLWTVLAIASLSGASVLLLAGKKKKAE